jgi:cardiolipin synthase
MTRELWTYTVFVVDWLIRIGLSVRVIMRRRPVGVSLAWIAVLQVAPIIGAVAYLFFGELRLGRRREERSRRLHAPYEQWLGQLRSRYEAAQKNLEPDDQTLARLITHSSGQPVLPDNAIELLDGFDQFVDRLLRDLHDCRRSCDLEFYIWCPGGRTDDLVQALTETSARGVTCRILVDTLGSRSFLKSRQVEILRQAKVEVREALPVSFLRGVFRRLDLRLHRKLIVIDGTIGYTGSQNVADPRLFKQDAGVGEWVDAMVRVTGPAVESMSVVFLEDWEQETARLNRAVGESLVEGIPRQGPAAVQVIASGPNLPPDRMETLILQLIYDARREVVLTTPYFVPSESMVEAMRSAALRGARAILVVPARIDSRLVSLASRAFQGDLAEAGVEVVLFQAGLLHTKSITIDGQRSLFGSVNLDPRSLQLNFEITLAIYGPEFTSRLRDLQERYIAQSIPLDLTQWRQRSFLTRFADNTARLFGPLI